MEHKYVQGKQIPFFDKEITDLIDSETMEGGGKPMDVGIENEQGELYRYVRCWGLGHYMRFTQGMLNLGFKDVLLGKMSQGGLDNRFVVTPKVLERKHSIQGDVTAIDEIESEKESLAALGSTERDSIIKSRLGQGAFRRKLVEYWQGCAVTGATYIPMLKASHIKPWRVSDNNERLEVFNGLLLPPNVDAAFDAGLVTFDESGRIVMSKRITGVPAYEFRISPKMRINQNKLSSSHEPYLAYHRENVFVGG